MTKAWLSMAERQAYATKTCWSRRWRERQIWRSTGNQITPNSLLRTATDWQKTIRLSTATNALRYWARACFSHSMATA